jgi:hypothetical protein
MKTSPSAMLFEEAQVDSRKELATSVDIESMENLIDHYDEPSYFFRGAIFGLIFCVPLWIVIFWLIT